MENQSSIDTASEVSDEKETKKKAQKTSGAGKLMGSFAVQPSRPEVRATTAEETDPEVEKLTRLSREEKQFVERELLRAAAQETPEHADDPGVAVAEAKVQEFRERVVAGEDSDEVLESMLKELQMMPEPEDISSGEPELTTPEEQAPAAPLDLELAPQDTNIRSGSDHRDRPPRRRRGVPPAYNVTPLPVFHPAGPALEFAADAAERYYQEDSRSAALFGGLIGYLIGRRRGRLSTEKKLLPVQKKIQKEVHNLQWQLQVKETTLRQAVRERTQLEQDKSKLQKRLERQPMPGAAVRQEAARPVMRQVAVEARAMHAPEAVPERIGHVVIAAKTPRLPIPEKVRSTEKDTPTTYRERPVDTLSHDELLQVSGNIIVDGFSLRQVYEKHQISERGLRRLVREHFRGRDIKKALKRELVEHEIDFERDPVLRDHDVHAPLRSAGPTSLEMLVKQAEAHLPGVSAEAMQREVRAAEQVRQEERRQQHLLDISLATIIAILLAIIIVLLVKRG